MKTSQNGIDLIKKFEGCKLTAYKCSAGVLTIGYGHTAGVKEGQKITQEQADNYLKLDLKVYEKHVNNLNLPLNQNQFDALVSFTYNCGSGCLKTLVKNRTLEQIAEALLLYNKANGAVLQGLVRRRKAERELFLSKTNDSNKYKVTAIALNVRTGPDTRYKILKVLYLNEIVEVAHIHGVWGMLANDLGWVSMKYLQKI